MLCIYIFLCILVLISPFYRTHTIQQHSISNTKNTEQSERNAQMMMMTMMIMMKMKMSMSMIQAMHSRV